MDSVRLNEREADTKISDAVAALAGALVETPQFAAFEEVSRRLQADEKAQAALAAYEAKYRSLEALVRLNALGPEESAELAALQQAVEAQESVVAYTIAQAEMGQVWQAVVDLLSRRIGMDYSAATRVGGCCG